MSDLGLKFRVPDLSEAPRPFAGEVEVARLDEVLRGLVGELGYRAEGPARVRGDAYLAERDVVVAGAVELTVGFDCVRCVQGLQMPVRVDFHHVISAPRRTRRAGAESHEVAMDATDEADDREEAFYDGEDVDLLELMREDVILELPMNPSCDHTPAGRCADYDAVLARGADRPRRWTPLGALLELKRKMDSEG